VGCGEGPPEPPSTRQPLTRRVTGGGRYNWVGEGGEQALLDGLPLACTLAL
jgi:hypothetical protein